MSFNDGKFPDRNGRPYVVFHTNTETEHPAQPTLTDWQTGGAVPNRAGTTSTFPMVDKTTVVATDKGRTTLDTVVVQATPQPSNTASSVPPPASKSGGMGPTNPLMWQILGGAVLGVIVLLILAKIYRAIRRRSHSIKANEERLEEQHQQRVMTNMMYNNSWTSRSTDHFNVVRADPNNQAGDDNGLAELPGDLPEERPASFNVGRGRPHTNTI